MTVSELGEAKASTLQIVLGTTVPGSAATMADGALWLPVLSKARTK